MKRLLALALLMGSISASAATVEVASGDWSDLPRLQEGEGARIGIGAVDRIHEVVRKGTCTVDGASRRRIEMTVPFAVQFGADGTLQRIVIQRLGCPQIESIMGRALLDLVEAGEFKPTGENRSGWYRSEISFSSAI